IPLHRPGDLGFTKNLAVEGSSELFPLLLEDDCRATRTLVRLHGHLPRTGDIGRKRERHTKHQRADQFEHSSSAITVSESEALMGMPHFRIERIVAAGLYNGNKGSARGACFGSRSEEHTSELQS